jgi:uncharacterized protein YcnI
VPSHAGVPVRKRLLAVLVLAAAALPAAAGPAAAHVEVSAASARQGSASTLTFAVASESADATTTAVKLVIPAGTALQGVTVLPAAGWTAVVTPAGSTSPSEITWTADDPSTALRLGNYGVFMLRATLPNAPEVAFRVDQTYSDGEVVRWDQPRRTDGTAPEKPAPVLPLYSAAEYQAVQRSVADSAAAGSGPPTWLVGAAVVGTGVVAGAFWTLRRRGPHRREAHRRGRDDRGEALAGGRRDRVGS